MDLPIDFLILLDWCIYFDNVEQTLQIYSNVPKPPKVILANPDKFNKWVKFARNYDESKSKGKILPFGEVFDSEEDYYEFWR